jgi:hypothetical protein
MRELYCAAENTICSVGAGGNIGGASVMEHVIVLNTLLIQFPTADASYESRNG